jgi:hypothetical protein
VGVPRRSEPAVIVCEGGSSATGTDVELVGPTAGAVVRGFAGDDGAGGGDAGSVGDELGGAIGAGATTVVDGRVVGSISVRSIGSGSIGVDGGGAARAVGAVGAGATTVPPLARATGGGVDDPDCAPRLSVGTTSSGSVTEGIVPVPHSAGRGSSSKGAAGLDTRRALGSLSTGVGAPGIGAATVGAPMMVGELVVDDGVPRRSSVRSSSSVPAATGGSPNMVRRGPLGESALPGCGAGAGVVATGAPGDPTDRGAGVGGAWVVATRGAAAVGTGAGADDPVRLGGAGTVWLGGIAAIDVVPRVRPALVGAAPEAAGCVPLDVAGIVVPDVAGCVPLDVAGIVVPDVTGIVVPDLAGIVAPDVAGIVAPDVGAATTGTVPLGDVVTGGIDVPAGVAGWAAIATGPLASPGMAIGTGPLASARGRPPPVGCHANPALRDRLRDASCSSLGTATGAPARAPAMISAVVCVITCRREIGLNSTSKVPASSASKRWTAASMWCRPMSASTSAPSRNHSVAPPIGVSKRATPV